MAGGIGPGPWPGQQYPVHCRRADPSQGLSVTEVLAAARAALPGAGVAGDGTPPPAGDGPADGERAPARRARSSSTRTSWPAPATISPSGVFDIRPDQEVLAYAIDRDGSERYTLRFRDLGSGDDLADVVEDVYYGSAWSRSCKSFYYVRPDKAMRPWQVWRHVLGPRPPEDQLVFQEDDERFFVSVGPDQEQALRPGHERVQDVERGPLPTGRQRPRPSFGRPAPARGRRVRRRPRRPPGNTATSGSCAPTAGRPAKSSRTSPCSAAVWARTTPPHLRPLLPYRPAVKIESVDAFARHALILERSDGLEHLRVLRLADGAEHVVAQPEPAYKLSGETSRGVGHRRRPLRLQLAHQPAFERRVRHGDAASGRR